MRVFRWQEQFSHNIVSGEAAPIMIVSGGCFFSSMPVPKGVRSGIHIKFEFLMCLPAWAAREIDNVRQLKGGTRIGLRQPFSGEETIVASP